MHLKELCLPSAPASPAELAYISQLSSRLAQAVFSPNERCQCSYRPFCPRLPPVWPLEKLIHFIMWLSIDRIPGIDWTSLVLFLYPCLQSQGLPWTLPSSQTCRFCPCAHSPHVILDFLPRYACGPVVYFIPGLANTYITLAFWTCRVERHSLTWLDP